MKPRHLLVLLAFATPPAFPADYVAVPARSSLVFSGKQDGQPFEGRFRTFSAEVSVDGAGAPARIAASIDVRSADTQNAERDQTLGTPEFFDTARFPAATFRATACRGAAPKFECDAELTIRDRTRPLRFPLTWTARGRGATLESTVVLQRLQFDVGTGDWADVSIIEDEVTVRVSLRLERKP